MTTMEKTAVAILAVASLARLLASFALFPANDLRDENVLSRALGRGVLPAVGAAILDPAHTWGHLEEACFWMHHSPDAWTDTWGVGGSGRSDARAGYNVIYTPGTRIVAPPLVVAFLGETLVCPGRSMLRVVVRQLLLLVADAIGAYCIYCVGMRIFEMEQKSNEAEIERHTKLSATQGKCKDDLVVPGILRPERGWIVGLASKIIPPEEQLLEVCESKVANGTSPDAQQQKEGERNGAKADSTENGTNPPSLGRDPILALDQLPAIAAASYFCNPISMLANAIGSTRTLWDTLMLLSVYYATTPSTGTTKEEIPVKIPSAAKAALSLAVATYADVGYGVFILPILVWRGLLGGAHNAATPRRGHWDWKVVLALFLLYTGCLHFMASLLVGGEPIAYRKVALQTMLPNVAFVQLDGSGSVSGPSLGLHWYMFVQVFDRFRPYFTVFVSGIPAMFAIPLMTRLHRYPSVMAATLQLLWAIFRPTTTVHTLILGLHLAMLNPRTIVRMRDPALVSFFALPVPILLFVTFHRMWLVTGNGNPNYIYFQCFAYGLFVTIITMEFVSATVKRDKVRRMIEKGDMQKLAKKYGAQAQTEGDTDAPNGTEVKDSGDSQEDDLGSKPEPKVVFL